MTVTVYDSFKDEFPLFSRNFFHTFLVQLQVGNCLCTFQHDVFLKKRRKQKRVLTMVEMTAYRRFFYTKNSKQDTIIIHLQILIKIEHSNLNFNTLVKQY